jgi:hypothetical protein
VDTFRVAAVAVRVGCRAVAAGSVTVLPGGLLMSGVVATMGCLCAFVDLGGLVVYTGRLIVQLGRGAMCIASSFMRSLSVLGGALSVLFGNRHTVFELGAAARDFFPSGRVSVVV